jgi:hypothetical protein
MSVGLVVLLLVAVAIRNRDCKTGHSYRLASSWFPSVLDLEGSVKKSRTALRSEGNTRTDPNHESNERTLGSAENL